VQLDFERRELQLKVVYYGPALSGKTTNLSCIHRVVAPDFRGRLMTLETRDDRTLFFDLLPMRFECQSGLLIKIKLFTVPGQVIHNATRRLVLQGADAVAFIADSQISETKANAESFVNLKENLRENGLDIKGMPLVIQFNKRDRHNIRTDEEIDLLAKKGKEPVFKAVATQGLGVVETFLGLLSLTWDRIEEHHQVSTKFGIRTEEIMTQLHSSLPAVGLPGKSEASP